MTQFELFLSAAAVLFSASSLVYVAHLVRVSGHDRLSDEAKVRRLIDTAPRGRFDNTLSR